MRALVWRTQLEEGCLRLFRLYQQTKRTISTIVKCGFQETVFVYAAAAADAGEWRLGASMPKSLTIS